MIKVYLCKVHEEIKLPLLTNYYTKTLGFFKEKSVN